MRTEAPQNMYGSVVVRLTDRTMLCRAPGAQPEDFTIPGTAWADLVSRCAAPHFRTSAFTTITRDSNPNQEVQLSYHLMTDDAYGYALLGDKEVSRRQGHAALDELAAVFRKMFIESPAKLTPQMVEVFAKPARDILIKYSQTGGEDKVKKVRVAVDEVKNLALDNVDRVIQRGQRIDDIVQASDDLQYQAQGFQRSSRDLSNQMWWNSVRGRLIFGGVTIVFVIIVLFVFFAGGDSDAKVKPQ